MAAYFKASQLMAGCHLPQLYIGLKYSLTNNTNLAEKFFSQALEVAPNDPFVLHELGVTASDGTSIQDIKDIIAQEEAYLCNEAVGLGKKLDETTFDYGAAFKYNSPTADIYDE